MTSMSKIKKDAEKALSAARYSHTLGVAECAKKLAIRHFPDVSLKGIETAAMLHDITKELSLEEQIKICERYSLAYSSFDIRNKKLFHARTAAAIAGDMYGLEPHLCDAIRWHTTGRAGMSNAEIVLYLADYIEDGRDWKGCIRVRNAYEVFMLTEDSTSALYKTMVLSFDVTIKDLLRKHKEIHPDMIDARNYFLELLLLRQ